MHICGMQKNGTDEPVCKAEEVETQVENKRMDTKGQGGGWWMNWEIGINTYTLTNRYKTGN